MKPIHLPRTFAILSLFASFSAALGQVTVVDHPVSNSTNSFYIGNRPPLAPSPFYQLPIGAITPQGWLRHQLEMERDGMTGHLEEISPWLDFNKSSWTDSQGRGQNGWEEMPYWLKGYGDLGYVLKDAAVTTEAKKWIHAVLATERDDGWFGPRELLTSLNGKPDLWPHMIMLNVLQSYYDDLGDPRVIDVMTRYFKWENALPASDFGEGYWPKVRFGDNLESIFWLYNRTGDAWLLDLARKIHTGMARWDEDVINWHNVNIGQGFRAGTVFWMLSHDPRHLDSAERNYEKVFATYGQFPGGGFVGDENSRPGYTDPRGGIETCGIVELMHSFEMLTKITGKPTWADRCEEIAFNSFPAAMTADEKALHYITCDNQIQLDRNNKSPEIQNRGTMVSYSPYEVYRCCQHNVSHGWPYYAEELWLATPDNGLCASLYSACEVTARAGEAAQVKITEETDYPFRDTVKFTVQTSSPAKFPLYLRIPQWCDAARLSINGKLADVKSAPLAFFRIERDWREGDSVTLQLPMKLAVRQWEKNANAVSVAYGPLSFSLDIKERFVPYTSRNDKTNWPEWEVFPDSPWNYGLVLDPQLSTASLKLIQSDAPLALQPFTPETAPLKLEAVGRRIPAWQADRNNVIGKLQPSPVKSDQPNEKITLIPMGAARLRVSMFPVIGSGPDAREWTGASPWVASASHANEGDTLDALNDGLEPANSNDHTIPRFTWWDHRGTKEWVQYDFPQPTQISAIEVYWFDDTGNGQCRIPASWRLLYRDGQNWKPVPGAEPAAPAADKWNALAFPPVDTAALRIEVQLQPGFSGGLLGWKIK